MTLGKKFTPTLLFVLSLTLVGCGSTMKAISGIKNPKVKTLRQLNDSKFIKEEDNEQVTDVVYKMPADSTHIIGIVLTPMTKRKDVFDHNKNRKCFTSFNGCGDIVFDGYDFGAGIADCDSTDAYFDDIDFFSFIDATATYDNNELRAWSPPKVDYYVVYYWSNIKGSKKRNRKNYALFENEIRKSKDDIHIIRVNCDLLQNWGLKKGKRLPIKFKKTGKSILEYEILFGDLPYLD